MEPPNQNGEPNGASSALTPALSCGERESGTTRLAKLADLCALHPHVFTRRRSHGENAAASRKRDEGFSLSWGRGPG